MAHILVNDRELLVFEAFSWCLSHRNVPDYRGWLFLKLFLRHDSFQHNCKGGAQAELRLDTNFAAELFQDILADVKTKTVTVFVVFNT